MEEIWARLTNGEDVKIRPYWDCCNGVSDCGGGVEIYDKEDRLIGTMPNGTMPDEDDYDLSDEGDKAMYDTKMAEFIADVERAIDEYEG